MRILHISTRLILGGSQENTVLSCEGQVRRGHEVHLAFGPIYGPEGSMLERVEEFRTSTSARIHTHVVPNLVREINPIKDRRALRELRALIERIRPDVVHTHSSKAGILGRWAAWQANWRASGPSRDYQSRDREGAACAPAEQESVNPADRERATDSPAPPSATSATDAPLRSRLCCGIVHTIHGPPFMPIEGGPLRRAKTRALNHAYTLAERSAARHGHMIVSVADAMTREFLRRGIGRPEQYVTVRSGMDIEPYVKPPPDTADQAESREAVRRMLNLKPDDFVVGTIARLAQHKGHDDLLDALAKDLRENPNWKLLWVGDGWWRKRLVDRAVAEVGAVFEFDANTHHHGVTVTKGEVTVASRGTDFEQVILTGLVPPEEIPSLIRAMDLLAHPSYREGLPRTVPQALLCGVPVVAYDCDGTGEVCQDMITGRLVNTGDTQALGEAIRWMATHPDERRTMALRGQERCLREFSAERMVEDLEAVYERALRLTRGA